MPKRDEMHTFKVGQVCDMLQISPATLNRWVEAEKIIPHELPTGAYGKPALRFTAQAVRDCLFERPPAIVRQYKAWLKKNNDIIRIQIGLLSSYHHTLHEILDDNPDLVEKYKKRLAVMESQGKKLVELRLLG